MYESFCKNLYTVTYYSVGSVRCNLMIPKKTIPSNFVKIVKTITENPKDEPEHLPVYQIALLKFVMPALENPRFKKEI